MKSSAIDSVNHHHLQICMDVGIGWGFDGYWEI